MYIHIIFSYTIEKILKKLIVNQTFFMVLDHKFSRKKNDLTIEKQFNHY